MSFLFLFVLDTELLGELTRDHFSHLPFLSLYGIAEAEALPTNDH